jgi:anti-sigma factor RsiW
MTIPEDDVDLTALADGTLSGPEWDAWLAAHPRAAAEVAIARRVRSLIAQLRSADIAVPPDFEVRVLERVHANRTLLDLLELSLAGLGRALLELLEIFFTALPTPRSRAM